MPDLANAPRLCAFPACSNNGHRRRAFCAGHLTQKYRGIDLKPLRSYREPVRAHFDRCVDQSGGPDACWPWTAGCTKKGYGVTPKNFPSRLANRVAWILAYGPILPGLEICHHCDNSACCNPTHLFSSTHAGNMADRNAKGRQACGERINRGALTAAAVTRMLIRHDAGESVTAIAQSVGIARNTASRIVNGKAWRHVPRG